MGWWWVIPDRAFPVDFGFAQYMSPWDEKHVLRGSPLYMAPEMVCRQQYDARVDLWSVGVILYGGSFFCASISLHPIAPQCPRRCGDQPHCG